MARFKIVKQPIKEKLYPGILHLEHFLRNPTVVGVSLTLKPKIKQGKVHKDWQCVRFYVKKKLPESELKPEFIIPKRIGDYDTDVVEIGELTALRYLEAKTKYDKRFSVMYGGISIGAHLNPLNKGISPRYPRYNTAGTLGASLFVREFETRIGGLTNAHVALIDPIQPVDGIYNIIQPGRFDGGKYPDDTIGVTVVATEINPFNVPPDSGCPLAKAIVKTLNFFARLFKRKTRFSAYTTDEAEIFNQYNTADAALFEIFWNPAEYVEGAKSRNLIGTTKFYDYHKDKEVSKDIKKIIGLCFAGNDKEKVVTVCKTKYILAAFNEYTLELVNYRSLRELEYDPKPEDEGKLVAWKIGRTTGEQKLVLLDDSAAVKVTYFTWNDILQTFTPIICIFYDVAIFKGTVKGGDSGALVFSSK